LFHARSGSLLNFDKKAQLFSKTPLTRGDKSSIMSKSLRARLRAMKKKKKVEKISKNPLTSVYESDIIVRLTARAVVETVIEN